MMETGPERAGLEAREIWAAYQGEPVLRGVSLTLMPGELAVVAGPNGAGKTTLLKAMSGLIPPLRGQVTADGRDVRQMKQRDRAGRTAFLFQGNNALWPFTVREMVSQGRFFRLSWLGRISAQDNEAVSDAISATGLAGFENRLVTELSGGELQRALIARALAQQAEVFLLDEAVNSLDPKCQCMILELLRTVIKRRSIAALLSLHDLNLAAMFADRIILLLDGQIAFEGSPADVLQPEILKKVFDINFDVIEKRGRPFSPATPFVFFSSRQYE